MTIAGFAKGLLETRDAVIVELFPATDKPAVSLGTLWPAGVRVRLAWPGRTAEQRYGTTFDPGQQWHRYVVEVPADVIPSASNVTAVLEVGPDRTVELKNVHLGGQGHRAQAIFLPGRQKAWFSHPNFAGHAIAALTVGAAATSPFSVWILAAGALLSFLTGSRAAFVVVLVASMVSLVRRRGMPRAMRFGVIAVLVIVAATATLVSPKLQRSPVEVTRPDIWQVAVQRVAQAPWLGSTGGAFATLSEPLETGQHTVAHAHNLWLQMAAAYGVPGAFGALWLAVALLVVAWRWGHWSAVGVVSAVLALNLVDFTLFQPLVITSLIWCLNVFHHASLARTTHQALRQ